MDHPVQDMPKLAPEFSTEVESKLPFMYQVVMLNDDYTPMAFVVQVLMKVFRMSHLKATDTALAAHEQGRAVCGIFTKDVAETKADSVVVAARDSGHPLRCVVEQSSLL